MLMNTNNVPEEVNQESKKIKRFYRKRKQKPNSPEVSDTNVNRENNENNNKNGNNDNVKSINENDAKDIYIKKVYTFSQDQAKIDKLLDHIFISTTSSLVYRLG